MQRIKILCVCFSFVVLCTEARVASFIETCNLGNNNCLLKSALKVWPYLMKGVPDLGIPSADPLALDDVISDRGELKLKFRNLVVHGSKQCQLLKIERSDYQKIYLEMECPIEARGQYSLGGKLRVLEAQGQGNCEIKTDKIKIDLNMGLIKVQQEDGKDYYKIKSFNYKYLPVEKFHFKFDNLFNGDRAKAETFDTLVNDSWELMFKEIGQPLMKEVITKAVNVIDKFFLSVPVSDIEKS